MLFNSLDFAYFLPIFFVLYWAVNTYSLRVQNCLIVVASYFFYAWWDWRFLGLIILSTAIDFTAGRMLSQRQTFLGRKTWLWGSIVMNLGILWTFKYYNFFVENFIKVFSLLGLTFDGDALVLEILLPIGISFYTFQTMSYTIDVYKRKIPATSDIVSFAAFVSFFPQLVAGPIERAADLLPQFTKKRVFNVAASKDGLRQILWGLFKKMVIADNCAALVDEFFLNYDQYNGSALLLGAFFFSIQIYGDFSGYSDMAIGIARLFGFQLSQNFAYPYFSRSISEFWKRWHISLTKWFKDYVYIPIGGSRGSKWMQLRNTVLIFVVIGFWHGAQWKFIIYGVINAIVFIPFIVSGKKKKYENVVAYGRDFPSFREVVNMVGVFLFIVVVRVFFRATDIAHGWGYLKGIFSFSLFELPKFGNKWNALLLLCLITFFLIIEWLGRGSRHALEKFLLQKPVVQRWGFYYLVIVCICLFYAKQQQFIYFQF